MNKIAIEVTRRQGKFYISRDLVLDGRAWPILAEIKFVPFRVEYLMEFDAFEYIGLSPLFREIPIGRQSPEYRIEVTTCDDGSVTVKAKEIKD